jgi:hypothetical protein
MNPHSTTFLAARSRELVRATAMDARKTSLWISETRQHVLTTRSQIEDSRLMLLRLNVSATGALLPTGT